MNRSAVEVIAFSFRQVEIDFKQDHQIRSKPDSNAYSF